MYHRVYVPDVLSGIEFVILSTISVDRKVIQDLAVLKAVSMMLMYRNALWCFFNWNHTSHNGDKFNF